jgi:quercetin dioxygenase-like cupin family protein
MTAVKIKLNRDEQTPDHCHLVPVFGYMLSSMIEVKTSKGTSTTFNEGEVIVEVMNMVHNGKAVGGDAEILAFYAGSTDFPNTIIDAESDAFKNYCVK